MMSRIRLTQFFLVWTTAMLAASGCTGVNVDEHRYVCDGPGQCGPGYACRHVAGESYRACYAIDDDSYQHTDASNTDDAGDVTAATDATTTSDTSTAPDTSIVPDTSAGADAADTFGTPDTSTVDAGASDSGSYDSGAYYDSGSYDAGYYDTGYNYDSGYYDTGHNYDSGYYDASSCNKDMCNGVCTDVMTDPSNCGTCGNRCAQSSNSTAQSWCHFGACDVTCMSGFCNLDGDPSNGCESTTKTFYRDQDNDGYGDPNNVTQACVQPAGYVGNANDCDDNNSLVHSGCTSSGGCHYLNKNKGVCATAQLASDGHTCLKPPNYKPIEFGCGAGNADGLDNDCDGLTDEIAADHVATGMTHACVLSNGHAWCWGKLFTANGSSDNNPPTPVPTPSGQTFTQISAGWEHTCAIGKDNQGIQHAFCWGHGASGQLGSNYSISSDQPQLVGSNQQGSPPPSPPQFLVVAAGGNHSCGITVQGQVACWGANNSGQLGVSSPTSTGVPMFVGQPASGTGTPNGITAGYGFTCGRTDAGAAACWGSNNAGKLGANSTLSESTTPLTTFDTSAAVSGIVAGYNHACAFASYSTTSATLYCWGSNATDQLGEGTSSNSSELSPVPVFVPSGFPGFAQVSAGTDHTCAIRNGDQLAMCWGRNNVGQLGNGISQAGATVNAPAAVKMNANIDAHFDEIAAGDQFTCAIDQNHNVYCWGSGMSGRLGNSATGGFNYPHAVTCAPTP